jgi:predicted transcriptional regulator
MRLSPQEKYDRIFDAAKRLGLSNNDLAILLQVTPAMVSRYRKNASRIGTRGDRTKLTRAARALKVVRTTGIRALQRMEPVERASACASAVREVDPELSSIKMPVML